MDPKEAKLLTTKDVAERFSVNEGTVRQWRTDGTGPKFVRTPGGGVVRYRLVDILAWEEKHLLASTTEAAADEAG